MANLVTYTTMSSTDGSTSTWITLRAKVKRDRAGQVVRVVTATAEVVAAHVRKHAPGERISVRDDAMWALERSRELQTPDAPAFEWPGLLR